MEKSAIAEAMIVIFRKGRIHAMRVLILRLFIAEVDRKETSIFSDL